MIKLMFELQEDQKCDAMCATDAMEMSPLHTATLFDHPKVVNYLIEQVNFNDHDDT